MNLTLNQPSLPFKREVRFSMAVTVHFTSNVTGEEIIHLRGQVFLLTDLFLVCERTHDQGKESHDVDEQDLYLCYPPLVGKHLRADLSGSSGIFFISSFLRSHDHQKPDNAVEVTIMNKERLVLVCSSITDKIKLLEEFQRFMNVAGTRK